MLLLLLPLLLFFSFLCFLFSYLERHVECGCWVRAHRILCDSYARIWIHMYSSVSKGSTHSHLYTHTHTGVCGIHSWMAHLLQKSFSLFRYCCMWEEKEETNKTIFFGYILAVFFSLLLFSDFCCYACALSAANSFIATTALPWKTVGRVLEVGRVRQTAFGKVVLHTPTQTAFTLILQ